MLAHTHTPHKSFVYINIFVVKCYENMHIHACCKEEPISFNISFETNFFLFFDVCSGGFDIFKCYKCISSLVYVPYTDTHSVRTSQDMYKHKLSIQLIQLLWSMVMSVPVIKMYEKRKTFNILL